MLPERDARLQPSAWLESTIVVTYLNVSRRQDLNLPLKWDEPADRLIAAAGPLYPVADVLALLKKGVSATCLYTEDCVADVAKEGLSLREVLPFVEEALQHGRYKNSQWCRQGMSARTVPCAPCDAYTVRYRTPQKRVRTYYVKFAISKPGHLVLMFSFHDQ